MEERTNSRLHKLLIEVVENQLRDNDPPIARETYERLLASGYSKARAKDRIAAVVIDQIYDILHDGKSFDLVAYEAELKALH